MHLLSHEVKVWIRKRNDSLWALVPSLVSEYYRKLDDALESYLIDETCLYYSNYIGFFSLLFGKNGGTGEPSSQPESQGCSHFGAKSTHNVENKLYRYICI